MKSKLFASGRNPFLTFAVFVLLSVSLIPAQTGKMKSPFISFHSGMFVSSGKNFSKTYDSRTGIVFGAGLGLPFSSSTWLYGKATYFAKSGVPIISTYEYADGHWNLISEKKEGSAEFKQWLFNGGLLVKIFFNTDWTFGITGGVTYSTVKESQSNNDGSVGISYSNLSAFGLFIGGQIEKNFGSSPFSVFIEPQYNFLTTGLPFDNGSLGGLNFNAGIRFYFKERRLE